MKYHTVSGSSLPKGRKSTLTIYADMDVVDKKMISKDEEMITMKEELQKVQKALNKQTRRCKQLVEEFTRRLQQKEYQYQCEKTLRDDQLAKVLRALLIVEARLKQEQKFISHQLKDKDYIIKKQSNDINQLLSKQYCKNCNQFYRASPNFESLDSSSEYQYVVTDYQESNFGSFDSSSETYATISEKDYNLKSDNLDQSGDDSQKTDSTNKNVYLKNKGKDSIGRRAKKFPHRKSVGSYFEVLKIRNDSASPYSNEDNTSNDYDNFDSLPAESMTDKISVLSEENENSFDEESVNKQNDMKMESDSDLTNNLSFSESNITVIHKNMLEIHNLDNKSPSPDDMPNSENVVSSICGDEQQVNKSKITDSISVFDGYTETNENWYASASDQEDEDQRDVYRDNPVLECVNQILLQNMNDALNSPPKTPNVERKNVKSKRVKFSDEEEQKSSKNMLIEESFREKNNEKDYYETPIQKIPNFYETPQSIYSNDYEQILSKCSESFTDSSPTISENTKEIDQNKFEQFSKSDSKIFHYYVDMDNKSDIDEKENIMVRKSKIFRTPPALPPKPANLVSKYKIQNGSNKIMIEKSSDVSLESEPDYCSISELNLPTNKNVSFKKINVIAEINTPSSQVSPKIENLTSKSVKTEIMENDVNITNNSSNMLVKKCVEKITTQMAVQTPIIPEITPPKKVDQEIPKLPQVSEIIIPEETDENNHEDQISQDNYVKNNTQMLKSKNKHLTRRPIMIGSSVSSLITGFNNKQLFREIKQSPDRNSYKKLFSSFENLQNIEKQSSPKPDVPTQNFDNFDLSQNFEEFKLDDCEIEEYNVDIPDIAEDEVPIMTLVSEGNDTPEHSNLKRGNSTRVELIRAKNDVLVPNINRNSIQMLKMQLKLQKNQIPSEQVLKENKYFRKNNEPTYEHFLECTGLSSKSILTPSRMLSNHKSVLKPKDVKQRSRARITSLIDQHNGTMKYWSEGI